MTDLDELERLASVHGGAHLDVYADALQIAGDVRGELIALDRKLEGAPDAALQGERDARLRSWLGALADQPALRYRRNGFLDLALTPRTPPELLAELAAHDLDAWVASLELVDLSVVDSRAYLGRIAARRWPRVATFVVDNAFGDDGFAYDLVARAVLGMPRLRELGLAGEHAMLRVDHLPELRVLRLRAASADLELLGAGPFGVTALALACDGPTLDLPAHRWPALRTLDVGHNFSSTEATGVYAALEHVAVLPQLHELRLPELTTEADRVRLQRALDRMPQLARLELRRLRLAACELHHPSAETAIPPPTPWPNNLLHHALHVEIPRVLFAQRVAVELAPALAGMERCYATLSTPSRDAWSALWHRLYAGTSHGDPLRMPMRDLRALFDDARVDWWEQLREAVAATTSDGEATLIAVP